MQSQQEFIFMGDIIQVFFFTYLFPLEYLPRIFQLRPSLPQLFMICCYVQRNQPLTCLMVTGTVHHVDPSNSSFSVTISQLVFGAISRSTVTIHAFLLSTPPWPHMADELPLKNQIVCFTAETCSVAHNKPTVIVDMLDCLAM